MKPCLRHSDLCNPTIQCRMVFTSCRRQPNSVYWRRSPNMCEGLKYYFTPRAPPRGDEKGEQRNKKLKSFYMNRIYFSPPPISCWVKAVGVRANEQNYESHMRRSSMWFTRHKSDADGILNHFFPFLTVNMSADASHEKWVCVIC